ncbi:MAG: UDP-N-acetylmuramate:L-alanyl-gamma-D-glutamyl-meso-diaminopimelate ligase [Desulfobacterales bacterium]|uniref:UDP-N-acetylmuramate:L-alanyl-gamma-D-glutamyl-meso-diaminopimelate ligase n=1 Tax=Candidatus Desulfaltia bathyphila TaxID=2841697 RepID=A0A8J6N7K1_9BACT|nr:UDP-N-acetylmuramate:L-alanyl-gamma-D-glutamyl-meso-diaminopimelate ligase [Candidatus Desulfaltia bathyphila]MBL7208417.1 UDP-N-acetylmuramate:L-alanyl-gamma-D-glutamyl-meso-diaminopimelate ligase [Desulfobacterales bacterium]
MDLRKNIIPDNVKKIHLIAICGTGMGALACMLRDLGFEVTGSDQKIYPPMSDFLSRKGIKVSEGFTEDNLSYGPDLVVVGNAVTKHNPEVLKMQNMGLNFCSMPQAINRFIADNKKRIIIAGTHGKTTTSSIVSWILYKAGLDPSFIIGGILKNFDSNYRLGKGGFIVIEGDEYDTAFFDKGAKFLHYNPYRAVLTSVEFDHADIFRDIDHVRQVFDIFLSGISGKSMLFAFDGDSNVDGLVHGKQCRVEKYGKDRGSLWRLGSVSIDPPWSIAEIIKQDISFGTFKTKLIGEHNLLNALSAIAIADSLMIPVDIISEALETFEGIKRRQEVRGHKREITVIDDFAHHPTAVRETIRAVKPFYPDGRLVAVFEPRTNSSMRKVFQNIYPLSFNEADLICIRKPPLLEKIPVDERFSSEKLVDDLNNRGKSAHYFPDTESIVDFLIKETRPGDVILIMSNGGFDNIHERLLKAL